jgi:hypothetical protein
MATIRLCSDVFQDGGQFYHEDFGLLANYGDLKDWDTQGAEMARMWFAEQHPEYAHVDLEAGHDQ